MSPSEKRAVREIIERELFCSCGACEAAVQDILRMEAMLCRGARSALGARRKRIRAVRRRDYDRRRYAQRACGSGIGRGM